MRYFFVSYHSQASAEGSTFGTAYLGFERYPSVAEIVASLEQREKDRHEYHARFVPIAITELSEQDYADATERD